MFNFIHSEVWWMDVIIAAAITGALALIGTCVIYLSKINKVATKANELAKGQEALTGLHSARHTEYDNLTKEHSGLASDHKELANEHKQLISDAKTIITTTGNTMRAVVDMSHQAEKERIVQQSQLAQLSDRQKNIAENVSDSLKAFQALKNELLAVNSENKQLQEENQRLVSRVNQIEYLKEQAKQETKELQEQIVQLLDENQIAVSKYNELLRSLQPPPSPEPTHYFDRGFGVDR